MKKEDFFENYNCITPVLDDDLTKGFKPFDGEKEYDSEALMKFSEFEFLMLRTIEKVKEAGATHVLWTDEAPEFWFYGPMKKEK